MKTTLLSFVTLVCAILGSPAEEAPKDETLMLATLLEATQENDLEKFESVCDDEMKEAMTEEQLTQVSIQVAPLMKLGYQKEFMGTLTRGAIQTSYWKIDFDQEGAPDMLAELSVQDGKAAGFFIR